MTLEDRVAPPLLEVTSASVRFHDAKIAGRSIRAVDDVTFHVDAGETLGLVGESGSGKSTIARAIVQIERLSAGEIRFEGQPLSRTSQRRARTVRRRLQMVFQDPFSSLNPRHRVRRILAEPLIVHDYGDRGERNLRVEEVAELIGLSPELLDRFPAELSGGQRQRVAIGRALAAGPSLVVCDEPVSALDVSIQAQIINLLLRLQDELGVAFVFIAHDLAVVERIANRTAVMYLGKIVETAPTDAIAGRPLHPYTKALYSAVPVADPRIERQRKRIILQGELPSPADPPSGCSFRTRCPWAQERCRTEPPPLRPAAGARPHLVACHYFEEIEAMNGSGV